MGSLDVGRKVAVTRRAPLDFGASLESGVISGKRCDGAARSGRSKSRYDGDGTNGESRGDRSRLAVRSSWETEALTWWRESKAGVWQGLKAEAVMNRKMELVRAC